MNLRSLRCLFLLAFAAGCTCTPQKAQVKPPPSKAKPASAPQADLEPRREALRPYLAPPRNARVRLVSKDGGRVYEYGYRIRRDDAGNETIDRDPGRGAGYQWRISRTRPQTIALLEALAEGKVTSFDFDVTTPAGTFKPCLRVTDKFDDDGIRKTHFYYCRGVGLTRIERIDGLAKTLWDLEKAP